MSATTTPESSQDGRPGVDRAQLRAWLKDGFTQLARYVSSEPFRRMLGELERIPTDRRDTCALIQGSQGQGPVAAADFERAEDGELHDPSGLFSRPGAPLSCAFAPSARLIDIAACSQIELLELCAR